MHTPEAEEGNAQKRLVGGETNAGTEQLFKAERMTR